MKIAAGQSFSHYRIERELGRGGMGVVFEAEDVDLRRHAALKFLSPELAQREEFLERFKREARAASALNHPNICTIYEIGRYENCFFISMELLHGQSLQQAIATAPMQTDAALGIALDVVDALDAAHAQKIIHRDIKPANIFLNERNQAKLLDFGLAKQTGDPEGNPVELTTATALTTAGAILGTVTHMSPEQARGQPLDQRSDLFSLGVTFYQMVTGRSPFSGLTSGEVLESLFECNPPLPQTFNPNLPLRVQEVIVKLLQKDPQERYQTAADLRADLKRLKADVDSNTIVQGEVRNRKYSKKSVVLFAVTLILLAAATAGIVDLLKAKIAKPLKVKISRISQWNKEIGSAALSPDGHTIAFTSTIGGVQQVFVMLTSGGEPLQLTYDQGSKQIQTFAPDGHEIYYRRASGRDESWAVPTLGGSPRRVVYGIHLQPSHHGEYYYYLKSDSRSIFRSNKSGLSEETIYTFKTPLFPIGITIAPDDKSLFTVSMSEQISDTTYSGRLSLENKKFDELFKLDGINSGDWLESGKSLVLSRRVNALTNLWKYEIDSKNMTQLTAGPGPDFDPMYDRLSQAIYYVNGKQTGSLVAYNVKTSASTELFSELSTQPIISPDGTKVLFIKIIEPFRAAELWVSDIDGKNQAKLASAPMLGTGMWSPDNAHVSFYSFENSQRSNKGFVSSLDGRNLIEIQGIEGNVQNISWSIDGKALYLSASDGPLTEVWKVKADGTGAERFVKDFYAMEATPDGRYILGVILSGKDAGIYEVSLSNRKRTTLLPNVETFMVRMSSDKKAFLYSVAGPGEILFYRQEWKDGKLIGQPKLALKLPFAFPLQLFGNAYDFSSDLSTTVYARASGQADFFKLSFENN